MSERRVGIVVSGDRVIAVDAEVAAKGPIVLQSDQSWALQAGPRENAYHVIYQQCANYLREHGIRRVVIKASAVAQGKAAAAHLHSAEVRGVIIAAAASICPVRLLAKATISRTFGKRKVDDYLKDDSFWSAQIAGKALRGGSREAALLLIADRDSN